MKVPFLVIAILVLSNGPKLPHTQASSQIVDHNINTCGNGLFSCSVPIKSGGTSYFYAATEGGAFNISPIDFTQDLAVANPSGLQSVVIGHSSSNIGTFNPGGALYPIIGGIGVNGALTQTIPIPPTSGASSISGTFTLAQDSLVILVSSTSNNNLPISLSTAFTIDEDQSNTACNGGSGCGSVVLAHASMVAGAHDFSLTFTPADQVPTSGAIGVVLYVFPFSNPIVTVSTDEYQYGPGGVVSITGTVSPFIQGLYVILTIIDSNSGTQSQTNVVPSSDGTFGSQYQLSCTASTGGWIASARYGGGGSAVVFQVVAVATGVALLPSSVGLPSPDATGIADYGASPAPQSVGSCVVPYSYETTEFDGKATISNPFSATSNSKIHSDLNSATLQLNTVLTLRTQAKTFTFWVQNFAVVDTKRDSLHFALNIWNYTGGLTTMNGASISDTGHGGLKNSHRCATGAGCVMVWYGQTSRYKYSFQSSSCSCNAPLAIELRITTSLSNGAAIINFYFSESSAAGSKSSKYDSVTIGAPAVSSNFVVNGFAPTGGPPYNNVEFVLGGPLSRSATSYVANFNQLSANLQLQYLSQTGTLLPIPHAWNTGLFTQEGATNVADVKGSSIYC